MYHHFLTSSRTEEENVHRLQLYHSFSSIWTTIKNIDIFFLNIENKDFNTLSLE